MDGPVPRLRRPEVDAAPRLASRAAAGLRRQTSMVLAPQRSVLWLSPKLRLAIRSVVCWQCCGVAHMLACALARVMFYWCVFLNDKEFDDTSHTVLYVVASST